MRKEYIILAPHPDDELIGCYMFLKNNLVKKVYYFFDCTEERKKEAEFCAKFYDFEPVFIALEGFYMEEIPKEFTLLVPNINDTHPHHKLVNFEAKRRENNKMYYSVDMNVPFGVLSEYDSGMKKTRLKRIYKSQPYSYTNEKFWLFEGCLQTDTRTFAIINIRKEGFHQYPNAPAPVSFLKNLHRHIFHITVKIEQFHDDRDIEYIMFKQWLEAEFCNNDIGPKSCEMLAKDILHKICCNYPGRIMSIKVMEDGENGAEVSFGI